MVAAKVFIDADQLPSNVPAINPAKISRNVIAVTSPIYGSIDNTSHANSSHRLLLDSCPDLTGRTVAARTYGSSSSEEGSGKICVVNYQKATSKDGLMVAASVFESA